MGEGEDVTWPELAARSLFFFYYRLSAEGLTGYFSVLSPPERRPGAHDSLELSNRFPRHCWEEARQFFLRR